MENSNEMFALVNNSMCDKIQCSLCKIKDTKGIRYCGVEICTECIFEMNKKLKEVIKNAYFINDKM